MEFEDKGKVRKKDSGCISHLLPTPPWGSEGLQHRFGAQCLRSKHSAFLLCLYLALPGFPGSIPLPTAFLSLCLVASLPPSFLSALSIIWFFGLSWIGDVVLGSSDHWIHTALTFLSPFWHRAFLKSWRKSQCIGDFPMTYQTGMD